MTPLTDYSHYVLIRELAPELLKTVQKGDFLIVTTEEEVPQLVPYIVIQLRHKDEHGDDDPLVAVSLINGNYWTSSMGIKEDPSIIYQSKEVHLVKSKDAHVVIEVKDQ